MTQLFCRLTVTKDKNIALKRRVSLQQNYIQASNKYNLRLVILIGIVFSAAALR